MADMNLYSLFMEASLVVKLVMLVLIVFSVLSWAIIIQRTKILSAAKREAEEFEDKFWSSDDLTKLYKDTAARRETIYGAEHIFYAGFKEFQRLSQVKHHNQDSIVEGASRAMRITANREIENAENQIPMLGTIGSTSPYIGLFGTVWGIMNAFIALGAVEQATLKMVAPGIAEALIATAIGLIAAIPAVMAYGRLSLRVSKLEQNYDNFTEEFITILYRQPASSDNAQN